MDGYTIIESAAFVEKSTMVDIATLIVACLTFCSAICYFLFEEYHRRKDAEPRCKIIERYHSDNVAVVIANRGSGILIIDSIQVKKNGQTRGDLITYMPILNQRWKGYSLEIANRDLISNEEIVLCAIRPKNQINRRKVMKALFDIEITVTYHSSHSKKQRTTSKKLIYAKHFFENKDYKI